MTDIRRLPAPVVEHWEWQLQGACRGADAAVFFHPEGERGPRKHAREAAAKAICAQCPVIEACAAHALATHEPYGVWGGLTEDDREEIITLGGGRSGRRTAPADDGVRTAS